MMRLDVLQNLWLWLALGSGAVLAMVTAMTYRMLWRPRPPASEMPAGGWRGIWRHLPWVLILLYVGTVTYAVIYLCVLTREPPNW